MTDRLPVLAAIDGSSSGNAALRYAAERARQLSRPLALVHVAPTFLPVAGLGVVGMPYLPEEFATIGRDILDEALATARALMPDAKVSGRLLSGPSTAALVGAADRAFEIVLGADHMPLIARIAIGSTTSGVASGSRVPVVIVPDYWSSATPSDPRIVVAIQEYAEPSTQLLHAGFELASEHQASLEFVHVWDLPPTYSEVVDSLTDYPAWHEAVRHKIERAAAGIAYDFPDVSYSVTATQGRPLPTLRDASVDARLLILGREPHHTAHFGHVGRTLLRIAACPVQVIPLQKIVDHHADRAVSGATMHDSGPRTADLLGSR